MGFMKVYEFKNIDKFINNKLNLSKTIRISSFSPVKSYLCKDIHIIIFDNCNLIEDFYINPRKKIKIKSKYLNDVDKGKLKDFFTSYGMNIMDYQLYKIDYRSLCLFN